MRQLTNLELVLLGILAQDSLSGYSLRKQFAITPLGQRFTATRKARGELRHWLHGPVTRHEVLADLDGLLLRFVFRAQLFGDPSAREFVVDLGKQVREIIRELEAYLAGPGSALPTAGRRAVESGLEGYRGNMRWIERAAVELGRSKS